MINICSVSVEMCNLCSIAGWVPPSLSGLSPLAGSLPSAPLATAAAVQLASVQPASARSTSPASPSVEPGDSQALFGLQSYASDSESDSSSSGDSASPVRNEALGSFF